MISNNPLLLTVSLCLKVCLAFLASSSMAASTCESEFPNNASLQNFCELGITDGSKYWNEELHFEWADPNIEIDDVPFLDFNSPYAQYDTHAELHWNNKNGCGISGAADCKGNEFEFVAYLYGFKAESSKTIREQCFLLDCTLENDRRRTNESDTDGYVEWNDMPRWAHAMIIGGAVGDGVLILTVVGLAVAFYKYGLPALRAIQELAEAPRTINIFQATRILINIAGNGPDYIRSLESLRGSQRLAARLLGSAAALLFPPEDSSEEFPSTDDAIELVGNRGDQAC